MKLKFRLFIVLCAAGVCVYTACKKSSVTTSDPTLTPSAVAGQVALNISQSLFGGSGGIDLSGGLGAPGDFAVHSKGKALQSLTNPECGLAVDTSVSFTGAANGGSATIAGTVKFNISCTNNIVSGFTTNDNLSIVLNSPSLDLSYKVAENLTLQSVNPTNPDANLSINGSLSSNGSYQFNTGTKRSGTSNFSYTLTSVIIDPSASDIVSGGATFSTQGTGPRGVWNYQGTITFLGNHLATVTINGKTYNVNLQTGAVS